MDESKYREVQEKQRAIEQELRRLEHTWIRPTVEVKEKLTALGFEPIEDGLNALQFLRRPEASYDQLAVLTPGSPSLPPAVVEQVEIEARYAGYIEKQRREVARVQRLEERRIPAGFDYQAVVGLRTEAREKLKRFRPATLGQAGRIQAMRRRAAASAALVVCSSQDMTSS